MKQYHYRLWVIASGLSFLCGCAWLKPSADSPGAMREVKPHYDQYPTGAERAYNKRERDQRD